MAHNLLRNLIDVIKHTMCFWICTHNQSALSFILFNTIHIPSVFDMFVVSVCIFSFCDFSLPQIILTGSNAVDSEKSETEKKTEEWTRIKSIALVLIAFGVFVFVGWLLSCSFWNSCSKRLDGGGKCLIHLQ